MIEEGTLLARRREPLTAEVDGETVMFHPDAGSYFALGSVGSRVWELLSEPRSVVHICATLHDEFDVEPDTCRAQVLGFVNEMHEQGLLELSR